MLSSLILATAMTTQVTYLPPMNPRQLAAYKRREGFTPLRSIETPRQRAIQRQWDRWNAMHARNVSEAHYTIPGAIRAGWSLRYRMPR
jgi:hypothetical protein